MSPSEASRPPAGPEDGASGSSGPRSWRARGKPSTGGGRYRWQKDWVKSKDRKRGSRLWRHRMKIATAGAVFVALLVVFLIYVFWQQPRTPLVAFAVTAYPSPIPPNAWAVEDVRAFRLMHGKTLDVFDLSDRWRKSAAQGVTAFNDELRRWGNWRRTPVILYVSMHGVVDAENTPCLLPPGSFSPDEADWLRVSELLAGIKKHLSPSTAKLLVLDCSRLDANWQLGVFSNSFAEALVGAVRAADVANLAVLCSAGPGQVGWDSPELGQSVFGHFVLRGLRGEADAARSGDGDGKVRLRELYRYLTLTVQHWVTQNRAAAQRPLLLTRRGPVTTAEQAPNFLLVWTSRAAVPQSEGFRSNVAESGVAALWREHELLRASRTYRHAPLHWAYFEHLLLRLEQLDRAGSAYQEEAADTRDKLLEVAEQLRRATGTDSTLVTHSLPLGEHLRVGGSYFDAARRAWGEFAEDPRQETARRLLAEVGPVDRTLQPGVIEIHFMRMLAEHLEGATWSQNDVLRQAASLRSAAEQVAAPEDERAFYAGQPLVDAADADRRVAEDLLFVGGEALSTAEKRWDQAETAYRQAQQHIDELAEALALRDRALRELPHYAWWQTRRLSLGQEDLGIEFDREVNATLLPVIREIHEIGSRLHRADALDSSRGAELHQLVELAQRRLDGLETRFNQDVQSVDAAADDQTALRRIRTLLEVPLVSGEQRNKLRASYRELRKQLHFATRPPGETLTEAPAEGHPARLARWQRHPAAALVDVAQVEAPARSWDLASLEAAQRAQFLARQGAQLRARLFHGIPSEVDGLLKESAVELGRRDATAVETRLGRSRADHLVRSAWALRPLEPPAIAELHPVRALRQLDLHNLLVWHGRRTVGDFWGPAEAGGAADESFFHLAARRDLQSARGLAQAASDATFEVLLQERLAVAERIGPPTAADVLLIDEEDRLVPESITVRHPPELAPEAGATASVSLRKAGGDGTSLVMHTGGAERRRIGLASADTEPEPIRALIDRDRLGTEETDFEAVWRFRGHVAVDSFRWHPEPDFRLTASPPKYSLPSIRVDGAPAGASVVFILDCSASMGRSIPGEGVSRMSVARRALREILTKLAKTRRFHVAVWFYGHRLRWGAVAGQTIPQNNFPRPIPGDVKPTTDVEQILEMGHFGDAELGETLAELQWARQFGETPLYLAMIRALETEFANQPPERTKSVVVITDGVNKQHQEPRPNTKQQVLAAWHEMQVPIHVVEFFLREDEFDDPAEDRRALSDLREIAAATGGDDLRVDDPQKLIEELERSLRLRYEVVGSSQEGVKAEQIGRGVEVDENRPYVVRLAADPNVSNECRPERGQALELQLDGAARKLKFRRFGEATGDPPVIEWRPVTQGRRNYLVAFHVPTWQRRQPGEQPDLRFPISIQDADGRFTPRPKHVWTQIAPVDPRQVGERTYPFYGLAFVNEQPVPLWHCDVPDWPRRVRQADLSVWCAFDPVEPDAIVSVGEAEERGRPLELDGSTFDVQLKSNPARVIVVERHDPPALLDQRPVRVMLAPPGGRAVAATTRRRYYIGSGAVAHLFVFDDARLDALRAYTVQLTSHATLRKASVEVEKVRISIPAGGALVRPD